jgi:hypothetical protein
MNKIYNQSGIEIIACGGEGSPIRCKEKFNITFDKLLKTVILNWFRGGLERHTDSRELFEIMDNDGILKENQSDLYRAVYFYFDEWNKGHGKDIGL